MHKVVLTSVGKKDFADDDIQRTVFRAIDLIEPDFEKVVTAVIKPNLCYYWDYSTGETTDPRVVSAIIDHVRGKTRPDVNIVVAEADASAMKTKYAFRMLGYEKLSREKNVDLINLSEGDIVNKEVYVKKEKFTLTVNKLLLDADMIINVPKLKHHRVAGVTCALKNMFGAISTPRKFVYHKNNQLFKVIIGMNKIVRSDLILVDGIIALGEYPKKMGLVMTGNNAFATDFVAARIMGYDPSTISYLRLGQDEVGPFQINLLEDGVKLSEIERNFPKQNYLLQRMSWRLQLSMLRTYARLVGDTIPPILDESG